MPKPTDYDQPFLNTSGETIPPYAVLQVGIEGATDAWQKDWYALDVLRVRKPDGKGKQFILNGPTPVPAPNATHTGMGYGTRQSRAHALFNPAFSPKADDELGPVAGQWWLGKGSGFVVVGDVIGSPPSLPGFPLAASTLAVRVTQISVSTPDNIIVGIIPVSLVPSTQSQFGVNQIQVLEGPDPRTNPGDPNEIVVIQNVPPKEYKGGDSVKAKKNQATGQWFPLDSTDSPTTLIYFELIEDFPLSATKARARPVKPDNTLDAQADQFIVLDERKRFCGKKAFTDVGGAQPGYRGWAEFFTADAGDGVPGWRIVDMEGPADLILVRLAEDSPADATGGVKVKINETAARTGHSDSERLPKRESEAYDFLAYDLNDSAKGEKSGAKWWLVYRADLDRYVFLAPAVPRGQTVVAVVDVVVAARSGLQAGQASGGGRVVTITEDGSMTLTTDRLRVLNLTETAVDASPTKQLYVGALQVGQSLVILSDKDFRAGPGFDAAKPVQGWRHILGAFGFGGNKCNA